MSGVVLHAFIELGVGEDENRPSVCPSSAMQRDRRCREKLAKEKKRFTDSLPLETYAALGVVFTGPSGHGATWVSHRSRLRRWLLPFADGGLEGSYSIF